MGKGAEAGEEEKRMRVDKEVHADVRIGEKKEK